MEPTPVKGCICRDVPFAELIRLHRQTGADFESLQRQTHCGTVCGLCIPYIKAALRTGRSALPVLSEKHLERMT